MKKFLAMLLALVMVFSLAACGGDETGESKDPGTSSPGASSPGASEPVDEPPAPATPAPAEAIGFDPVLYLGFENTDGLTPKTQIINMATWAVAGLCDSYHPITLTEDGQGVKGKALYLDGNYGLTFDMPRIDNDTYTISFWYYCEKPVQYGPVIQVGRNISGADADAPIAWINFTKVNANTWPVNTEDIMPVVWNRNSSIGTEVDAGGVFPWIYAMDNQMHGFNEWCMVTVVVNGTRYTADDGMDRIETKLYVNGAEVWDANTENMFYQGISPEIFAGDNNEGLIGVNYWDLMYKGFIDEFCVYDKALTAGQVTSLFEQGNPPASPKAPETPAYVENEEVQFYPEPADDITPDPTAIKTIGPTTRDIGYFADASDAIAIADGGTVVLKFNNYSAGVNNWDDFILAFGSTDVAADVRDITENRYFVARPDLWAWSDNADTFTMDWTDNSLGADWPAYIEVMKQAVCDVTITRDGGVFTATYKFAGANGTTLTAAGQFTSTMVTADSPVYIFLSADHAYVELLSADSYSDVG